MDDSNNYRPGAFRQPGDAISYETRSPFADDDHDHDAEAVQLSEMPSSSLSPRTQPPVSTHPLKHMGVACSRFICIGLSLFLIYLAITELLSPALTTTRKENIEAPPKTSRLFWDSIFPSKKGKVIPGAALLRGDDGLPRNVSLNEVERLIEKDNDLINSYMGTPDSHIIEDDTTIESLGMYTITIFLDIL